MVNKKARELKQAIEYVRVSTQGQGRSGLGLEAQREAIQRFCEPSASTSSRASLRLKAQRAIRLSVGQS